MAGKKTLSTIIDEGLYEELQALLGRTGRTVSAEVSHALRRHLDSPPTVQAPPIPPALIADQPERKRGRKRKERKP